MLNNIQKIFQEEARAILNIPVNDSFDKAIQIVYKHVHHNTGKVITSGMGKAGQIAVNIATCQFFSYTFAETDNAGF